MTTNHGDELGTDRSQRHWRLVTVQAGGGLTVVRQRTRRSMQQLHLAGFLAKHSCTVAGIGDTRLGDDVTTFSTTVRDAAAAEAWPGSGSAEGGWCMTVRTGRGGGRSPADKVWLGGVADEKRSRQLTTLNLLRSPVPDGPESLLPHSRASRCMCVGVWCDVRGGDPAGPRCVPACRVRPSDRPTMLDR